MARVGAHLNFPRSSEAAFRFTPGNNVYIDLEPDSRAEADRPCAGPAAGGQAERTRQERFRGGDLGSRADRHGSRRMSKCMGKT
jgi:PhnB protein